MAPFSEGFILFEKGSRPRNRRGSTSSPPCVPTPAFRLTGDVPPRPREPPRSPRRRRRSCPPCRCGAHPHTPSRFEAHQVGVQVVALQQGPDHSGPPAGGTLFFAFPARYASGLYLPLVIVQIV